jgi:UDP-N-acetylglucosamine/UDP-N-acetylgalactosamine diphosphorylase
MECNGQIIDVVMDETHLRDLAKEYGQEHIFRFWDELRTEEKLSLLEQLRNVDFALTERLLQESPGTRTPQEKGVLRPAPIIPLPGSAKEERERRAAQEKGEALLREGRVACYLVAGGQGTRLGFNGPKGTFTIGPVSQRSLFQIHAEKIRALSVRYGATVPWYILTSEGNHQATIDFFQEKQFFGLGPEDVHFFQQEMLPAVDTQGKFLLQSKSHILTSPNGHGGSLKALHKSGALKDMRDRGVDTVFYFQVDNPLVAMCDPVFLGHHALGGSEMSSKVVRKSSWEERVGVIVLRDGVLTVIEYSDLSDEEAKAMLSDGSLKYWAGSIAVHALSVDFVERLNKGGFSLPYHRASKKVPYLDPTGNLCEPEKNNAIKFETFVFDALNRARNSMTLEVSREEEFSPVKNATGNDSPLKSRKDMTALYLRWLESCGAKIEWGEDGSFEGHVEINPRSALDAGDLSKHVKPGTIIRDQFTV